MTEIKDKNTFIASDSDRRKFLKSMVFLGSTALISGGIGSVLGRKAFAAIRGDAQTELYEYTRNNPENIIYSTGMDGNRSIPVKCKIVDGVLVKIDGNPYSGNGTNNSINYNSSLSDAAAVDTSADLIAQAGVGRLYNPHRLRKVLKRKSGTARGAGEWETIDFHQAVSEIVEGGDLFGEGHVTGLRSTYSLKDRDVARILEEDVKKIQNGEMTVAEFNLRHASQSQNLIDPAHPDLGPGNNRLVWMSGKSDRGRREFIDRFARHGFGTVNIFEDQTLKGNSQNLAWEISGDTWIDGYWVGRDEKISPDFSSASHAIFFGTGFAEVEFRSTRASKQILNGISSGSLTTTIVDPRMSPSASKANTWVPIEPGSESAFAMGMIRWIIDNHRYDSQFLENSNLAAAKADGENAFAVPSYLVRIENGHPVRYLRASDLGIGTENEFVVSRDGNLIAVNPNDLINPVKGDLLARIDRDGLSAKTAFEILKNRVQEKTLAEYASISGVTVDRIAMAAAEFSGNGSKSVAVTGGIHTRRDGSFSLDHAVSILNLLVGNIKQDGVLKTSIQKPELFGFNKNLESEFPIFGIKCNREGATYEKSTLFNGSPSKRLWYQFNSDLYHEVIPSLADKYPYGVNVLFMHNATSLLSMPSGDRQVETLRHTSVIPLVIACDTSISDTNSYADYIFPDTESWERWGIPDSHDPFSRDLPVCQPAVGPIVESVELNGYEVPINLETLLIAIAGKLDLPGFGNELLHSDDFYMRAIAEIAASVDDEVINSLSPDERRIFDQAREHLPSRIFNESRMKAASKSGNWDKVVYILNRGGLFDNDNRVGDSPEGMFHMFIEKVACGRNSRTNEYFDGLPSVKPIPGDSGSGYPFNLLAYLGLSDEPGSGGLGRNSLTAYMPENVIMINTTDAEQLGISNGDRVCLASERNPSGSVRSGNGLTARVEGLVKTSQGIRPGVIAVPWSPDKKVDILNSLFVDGIQHGTGSNEIGVPPGVIMGEDPRLAKVASTDPISGDVSFVGSRVQVRRV